MNSNFKISVRVPAFGRLLLVWSLLLFGISDSKAADYYWVGGSGNWSDYGNHWATTSGGTIFHTTIPSLNDNVFFDALSFNAPGQSVVFDNTFIYCNNMDWTGVQNNPSVNGLASTLHVYGSLKLVADISWVVRRIDFPGSGLASTIESAGQQLDTLYFTGPGSTSLLDPIVCKSIYIYDGSFASNNHNIVTNKFIAGQTGGTVNVDLGSSNVYCSDVFKAYDGTINMTSSNTNLVFQLPVVNKMYLWSAGKTFKNLTFLGNTEVIGSFTCDSLVAGTTFYINANSTSSVCQVAEFSGNTTLDCNFTANSFTILNTGNVLKIRTLNIGNSFVSNGICGQPNNIRPIDFLALATINKSSGSVVVDYCIITSVNAAGGAVFTANNSIDGGGNSGWIINAAQSRVLYWVGGTGSWNDTDMWSLSSGGAGGNCIPSSIDDVIFDSNSFLSSGDSVILAPGQSDCRNMDWSSATNNPVFASVVAGGSSLFVYGSVALNSGMNLSYGSFQLSGSANNNTFLSAGLLVTSILINGSGSWELSDELNCQSLQVAKGTFSTNSFDIHGESIAFNGINNLIIVDLGTSTLFVGSNYMAFSPLITLNSTLANIEFYNSGGSTVNAQFSDDTYSNVTVNSYTYISGKINCSSFISNSGVFVSELDAVQATFYKSFSGRKLEAVDFILMQDVTLFGFDTLTVINNFSSITNCNAPLSIKPYSISPAVFTKAAGTVNIDYVYLNSINATGGAVFNANNSWDLGNNQGWNISSPAARDLYWIGNGGEWDDPSHWALSSNGTPGNCPPTLTDNIFFDSNSITQPGETINISTAFNSYCHDVLFSGIPAGTVLNSGSNSPLYVGGSAVLVPELDPFSLHIETAGPGTGVINTGNNFIHQLTIKGSGVWDLQDNLNAGNLYCQGGTFNTNGYNINAGGLNTGGNAIINMGTSTITLLGFYSQGAGVTIDGDSADIVMTSSFLEFRVYNGFFNSVTFTGNANTTLNFGCNRLIAMGNFTNVNSQITAGYAEFKNDVTLTQPFTVDTLVLDNPGDLVRISQLNLNDSLIANGNGGFPIQIEGLNGAGTITKSSGVVCVDYLLLKDITATGGAQFFAGANSVDLGGNSGWIFNVCSPFTDVWPGDANYDLVADNNDILNIGLAFGYSGPVRANPSIAWVNQPSQDWPTQFANGANLKHADTDGSGFVDYDDTLAVVLNYGLTHPFRLMPPSVSSLPSPELYVVASPDTVFTSDTVNVEIFLGTNTNQVDSIYGIAFTINVDTAIVSSTYLSVDFTNCWMGTSQVDLITFDKDLLVDGRVDYAIVRTDQTNINGYGLLARMGIVIVDNVGAKITTPVTLSNITAITASESLLTIINAGDSIVVDTTTSVGLYEYDDFGQTVSIYPNPATDKVYINVGDLHLESYELLSTEGRLIRKESNSGSFLNTSELRKGVYFLKLLTNKGVVVKRIEIIRN